MSPAVRDCLIAIAALRWCFEQSPLRLFGAIFKNDETKRLST